MNTQNEIDFADAREVFGSIRAARAFARSTFVALLFVASLCASGSAFAQAAASMNVRTVLSSFTDSDSSGTVTLGDTLHFTITATNTGSVGLTNVQVNDPAGAGFTCATLAVNATCVETSSYVVVAADVTAGEVGFEGRATSNETGDVSNTAITKVFGATLVTLSVVENDETGNTGNGVTVGTVLHYHIFATNVSNANMTNVSVVDPTLSPTTTFLVSTLSPNNSIDFNGDYTVTAADVSAGHVTNTATLTSDQLPGGVSYSVTTLTNPSSGTSQLGLASTLTSNADNDHSGTVTVGDVLTFTTTATNTGNTTLTSVQISDPLLTPNSNTCASVAVGATCTLTGTHTVTSADAAAGQIVDTPTATSAQTSNNEHNAPAIVPVATTGGAAMSVIVDINNMVDVDGSGTVSAGDTVQFVVTAINAGSVALTNVQVSNPQTTPSTTTCASVAVGGTCVLDGTYTIQASDISNSMKKTITGSATSTQVPGPVSLTRDIKIDGNTLATVLMQKTSGDMQSGAPGTTLPIALQVRLVDILGAALPGYPIRFLVLNNTNGHVTNATATTDANGQASTQLVLPSTPGTVSVVACSSNDCAPDALFTAFATGAVVTPPALTIVSGNNQVLPVNTTSAPMIVQLMNNGSPVVGATINWSGNNVHLTNATSLTDGNGKASNTATVTAAGAASVSALSSLLPTGPVTFSLNGDLTSIPGLTPQQQAVAGALNNACPALSSVSNPTPAQQDLLAQCQALGATAGTNPAQAANAINQMLPHDTLIQSNASVLVSSAQFDNIKARMAALRSGAHGGSFGGLAFTSPDGTLPIGRYGNAALGMADASKKSDDSGSDFDRWGFFASGSFGWGSADARQATPGYGFHTNGLTAGVDYRFNDNWVLGASAGYAKYSSSVDVVGGGLDTHGWSLSGYTTVYQKNNWYVDGVLTWSSNNYDINRRIVYALGATTVNQTATSNSGGDTIAGALTVGKDFNNAGWTFGPYFRGTYSHTNFDGYQETLVTGSGSGLGLAVNSRSLKSVATVLGAKLNYASSQSWGVLSPHAEIEWEHEYEDNPDTVNARFLADPTSSVFQIQGDPVDTNFFRLGLGLSFTLPKGKSGFVYYEKTVGITGLTQDDLTLGFRMEF